MFHAYRDLSWHMSPVTEEGVNSGDEPTITMTEQPADHINNSYPNIVVVVYSCSDMTSDPVTQKTPACW